MDITKYHYKFNNGEKIVESNFKGYITFKGTEILDLKDKDYPKFSFIVYYNTEKEYTATRIEYFLDKITKESHDFNFSIAINNKNFPLFSYEKGNLNIVRTEEEIIDPQFKYKRIIELR